MKKAKKKHTPSAMYDMGAICNLTGLTPHVLRSWETRHGIVAPTRLKNGRRAYSPEDLKKLQNLKTLTDHGHRIGTLAKLDADQVETRLKEIAGFVEGAPRQAPAILGVTLIGETLSVRSQNWTLDAPNYIDARYPGLAEASADPARPVNQVVVLEIPTVHESTLDQVSTILTQLSAQHALVSYQFGPHQYLTNMARHNITLCPGVMTQERLNAELARLSVAGQVRAVRQAPVRTRRYSQSQLAHIASLAPTVACECPRHVSSLLSELTLFEDYSAECESLKPGDKELHQFLSDITARARNLMEQAMAKVIEQEGLPV